MPPERIDYMRESYFRHASAMLPGRVLDLTPGLDREWHRDIWESGGWMYVSASRHDGLDVDVVLENPLILPFGDATFEAVVSGHMLESHPQFWLSFVEMSRVLRPEGLMIHIAPSRGIGPEAEPDCWRFYRDGMAALGHWVGLDLVEATTDWSEDELGRLRDQDAEAFARLRRTMRHRGARSGETVGVFRKRMALWESPAAAHFRHFAQDIDRQARPLRFAAE